MCKMHIKPSAHINLTVGIKGDIKMKKIIIKSVLFILMLVALVGAIIIFGIDILYGSIQLHKARKGNFSIAVESLVKMEDFKFSFWQFI